MNIGLRNVCCYRYHLVSNQLISCIRAVSTTPVLERGALWPPEKIRRTGRKPTVWKGQGGRRAKIPYDRRYPLSGKDINDSFEGLRRGGSAYMNQMIGDDSKLKVKRVINMMSNFIQSCVCVCVCVVY